MGDATKDLMDGIVNCNLAKVKEAIAKGANVNYMDEGKCPVLTYAAGNYREGNFEIVKCLVEHGADVNAKDIGPWKGASPLIYAAQQGNLNVVRYLVEKGADINAATEKGVTVLMQAVDVYDLPPKGGTPEENVKVAAKLSIVKYLIEKGANVNAVDQKGKTVEMHTCNRTINQYLDSITIDSTPDGALASALKKNDMATARSVLDKGANPNGNVETRFRDGTDKETALLYAIKHCSPALAQLLIEKGANIDAVSGGGIPLMEAVINNKIQIVRLLVEKGADVNAHYSNGESVLMEAVSQDNMEMIMYLIDHGADVNATTTISEAIDHGADVNATTTISEARENVWNTGSTQRHVWDCTQREDIKRYLKDVANRKSSGMPLNQMGGYSAPGYTTGYPSGGYGTTGYQSSGYQPNYGGSNMTDPIKAREIISRLMSNTIGKEDIVRELSQDVERGIDISYAVGALESLLSDQRNEELVQNATEALVKFYTMRRDYGRVESLLRHTNTTVRWKTAATLEYIVKFMKQFDVYPLMPALKQATNDINRRTAEYAQAALDAMNR